MRTLLAIAVSLLVTANSRAAPPSRVTDPAGPGIAQQIGEKLDHGVEEIGQQLRRGWAEIRGTVDRLGVQGRVYGRLHWDKALNDATIDILVRDNSTVVLTGSVLTEGAKHKAESLTQDTVGVNQVVNRLAVAPTTPHPPTPPVPFTPSAGEK